MQTYFRYKGFVPEEAVKMSAATAILELMRSNEDASTIVARAEFDGMDFHCSIDLFDVVGSECVMTTAADPITAIHQSKEALKEKIKNREEEATTDYFVGSRGTNPNLLRASSQRSSFGPPAS